MSDPTLADELDAWLDRWEEMKPYQTPRPVVDADVLRAAAAVVRAHDALLDAARMAVNELAAEHQPMWVPPSGGYTAVAQPGREPVGCCICFPHDGSWPCTSALIVQDFAAAVEAARTPTEGEN